MDSTFLALLEYTKAALNQTTSSIHIDDEEQFFLIARQQGLSGMFYPALGESTNESLKIKLRDEFYRYTKADALQEDAIIKITNAFASNQIPHVFLKGAYMKRLYPNTSMRSMGDIDVLIPKEKKLNATKVMISLGFSKTSEGPTHDVFEKGRIHVEVHPEVDQHFDPLHLKSLIGLWDRVIEDTLFSYRLNDIDLGIYLLAHLAKHFRSSGVGMRQILDIGIWENHVRSTLNNSEWISKLRETQLYRFYISISWLNQRWFNIIPLLNDIEPCDISEEEFNRIETYIIASGVHGKAEGFNSTLPRFTSEMRSNPKSHHPKLSVFLSTVFPRYDQIVISYTYLKRHKWLLPIAWVSRWFNWIFKQPSRSLRKLKEYNLSDKLIQDNSELYKKLGL